MTGPGSKATGTHSVAPFLNETSFLVDTDPGSSWLLTSPTVAQAAEEFEIVLILET